MTLLKSAITKNVLVSTLLFAGVALILFLDQSVQSMAAPHLRPGHAPIRAAGTANSYTTTISISTYPYAGYLSDRHNDTYNIDYKWLNWDAYNGAAPGPAPRNYELLVVENDYLKLAFLPELGGRVYQAIFKPTGNNELYQNPVLKPTHWGPPEQGWWLGAGGIEWGLPVEEHGYASAEPWSYQISSAAGGITVTLRDSSAPDRIRAAISIYLPADRAYFTIRPRIENARSTTLNYKYWTNAMLAPGPANTVSPELRFIYPVEQVTIHSTGDPALPDKGQSMAWPEYGGRDMSRLGNWRQWLGFFERPAAQGDFTAIYDTSFDEGMVRVFPGDQARGAKGFAFGWGENALPAELWTDDGSAYIEMHGGVASTFGDSASLAAGASYEWQETWYPAAGIGGVTAANREAALYLDKSGDTVTIGVHSTASRPGSAIILWRKEDTAPLHHQIAHLSPAQPYKATLAAGGDITDFALIYLDAKDRLLATTETSAEQNPPDSQLAPLPSYTGTTEITLTWSGNDDSAILNYDLQIHDGYDTPWTDWLTRTTQTSSTYTGLDGHTYFFRVRARDIWGNVPDWRSDSWGDAFTSVLITPAPVLITSGKKPAGALYAPGSAITYTLSVRNSGNLTASAQFTDTLPNAMILITETLASSQNMPVAGNEHITWQGQIAAGEWLTVTYTMSPTMGISLLTPITNTLTLDGGLYTPFNRTGSIQYAHSTLCPLIAKNH